ncbi:MAG: hypothetical protein ACYCZR_08105 [Burkholderiales bacterium]
MTKQEKTALAALKEMLALLDPSDWHLVHATVREDVRSGKYSKEFEKAYKGQVDAALSH